MKTFLKIFLLLLLALVIVLGAYVIYVLSSDYRIEDNTTLSVMNNKKEVLQVNTPYTALTYNIGFGAYSPDYSFFMDSAVTKDGETITGYYGKAMSKEDVLKNTNGVIDTLSSLSPDFILLQEVDTPSDRSYNVNQKEMITSSLVDYSSVYAVNYHSPWLNLPLYDPIGRCNSGLLTLSKYRIDESVRRSYPLDEGIMRVTDLDRCFTLNRLPVSDDKELVLINSHMSAYDKGGTIREKQLSLIKEVLSSEYEKGNYVILSGDFNHALGEEFATSFPSAYEVPSWVSILRDSDLPEHFSIVKPNNSSKSATCRNANEKYEKGHDYETIVDGFIVSDNIKAEAVIHDNGYAYSDHQSVELTFTLYKEKTTEEKITSLLENNDYLNSLLDEIYNTSDENEVINDLEDYFSKEELDEVFKNISGDEDILSLLKKIAPYIGMNEEDVTQAYDVLSPLVDQGLDISSFIESLF